MTEEQAGVLKKSNRDKLEDLLFDSTSSIIKEEYKAKLFLRVGGKKVHFINVDFSHTYFENCYFRNCIFESCNFNGCKFTNCNLSGSSFPGSNFDYATFEKSFVDTDILKHNCPKLANLKKKFARSLRVNYHGLGDMESVTIAMKIELNANREHLLNCWFSEDEYHRKKYRGFDRLSYFFQWIYFVVLDVIWGNGESSAKLIQTGFVLWIGMTLIDVFYFKDANLISNYFDSFFNMPGIFFGVSKPNHYSELYLAIVSMLRLIGFGLFMSLILKKYNKR